MPTRRFDGVNDSIHMSIGSCNRNAGNTTWLVLMKKLTDAAWQAIMGLHSSAGTAVQGWEINTGNLQYWDLDVAGETIGPSSPTPNDTRITVANGWVIMGASKVTGTQAGHFHRYIFSTADWNRGNGGTMVDGNSPGATGTVRFGEWQGGDDFNGNIAVAGIWDRVLTDTEVDALTTGLQAWVDSTPVGLWAFNQDSVATAVEDITGNGANQSAITGTSVDADVPAGFDFSLGGTTFPQTISAGATGTASRAAQAGKVLQSSGQGSVAATRSPRTAVLATASGQASALRLASLARVAAGSGTAVVTAARTVLQQLVAAAAGASSLRLSPALALGAAGQGSPAMSRDSGRALGASGSASASVVTALVSLVVLSVQSAGSAVVTRVTALTMRPLAFVASSLRRIISLERSSSASAAPSVIASRLAQVTLSVISAGAVSIVRQIRTRLATSASALAIIQAQGSGSIPGSAKVSHGLRRLGSGSHRMLVAMVTKVKGRS